LNKSYLKKREKSIKQKIVKAVTVVGGLCPKFVSPSMDGMPNRLVLLPDARLAFAEMQVPGKSPAHAASSS
jgi:hypothetical protein